MTPMNKRIADRIEKVKAAGWTNVAITTEPATLRNWLPRYTITGVAPNGYELTIKATAKKTVLIVLDQLPTMFRG